jgi:membrane protein
MIDHDGIEHAGYLAFLCMLSIFPFLFFLMAIASLLNSTSIFEYIIDSFLQDNNLISFLKPRMHEIASTPPNSLVTFAILSAIWTASSIFEAMRTILNRANRVINTPSYLLRRLLSIFEFIIIIIITILLIFIFGFLPSLLSETAIYFNFQNYSYYIAFEQETKTLRDIIIILYGFFIIAFLYYFLPNKKQKILYTLPGAALVILFWNIFTFIFKYYLASFSQLNIIYGSIVGVIISLLYFYFCSIIFIVGAEFNYHFKNKIHS